MTAFTEQQIQTARNLVAIYNKYGTIPTVLGLAVNIQESGLDDNAENVADAPDYGGSYGNFQLNQDPRAHPNTAFVAVNPWYDYGYPEVRSSWEAAFHSLGGWSSFLNDPEGFLSQFAPKAQGSVAWSRELAAARLNSACILLEQL